MQMSLEESPAGTRMTLVSQFATVEQMEQLTSMGMVEGLTAALGQIEKQFGKGSVMKMGEKGSMAIEAVSTGALSLDLALGIGGLPRGRVTEI